MDREARFRLPPNLPSEHNQAHQVTPLHKHFYMSEFFFQIGTHHYPQSGSPILTLPWLRTSRVGDSMGLMLCSLSLLFRLGSSLVVVVVGSYAVTVWYAG
jgi:hypothetical protein